jgi:hypothetical protein
MRFIARSYVLFVDSLANVTFSASSGEVVVVVFTTSLVQDLGCRASASEGGLRGRLYNERLDSGGGLALWSFGWRGAGGRSS